MPGVITRSVQDSDGDEITSDVVVEDDARGHLVALRDRDARKITLSVSVLMS